MAWLSKSIQCGAEILQVRGDVSFLSNRRNPDTPLPIPEHGPAEPNEHLRTRWLLAINVLQKPAVTYTRQHANHQKLRAPQLKIRSAQQNPNSSKLALSLLTYLLIHVLISAVPATTASLDVPPLTPFHGALFATLHLTPVRLLIRPIITPLYRHEAIPIISALAPSPSTLGCIARNTNRFRIVTLVPMGIVPSVSRDSHRVGIIPPGSSTPGCLARDTDRVGVVSHRDYRCVATAEARAVGVLSGAETVRLSHRGSNCYSEGNGREGGKQEDGFDQHDAVFKFFRGEVGEYKGSETKVAASVL